jgi:hypothetical protein
VSTTTPIPAGVSRRRRLIGLVVAGTAIATVTGAVLVEEPHERVTTNIPTREAVFTSLNPAERQNVEGIGALTPGHLAAGYENEPLDSTPPTTRDISTTAAVLAGLALRERQDVEGIMAMTPEQLAAAYGNQPLDPTTAAVLAGLGLRERQYVEGVMAMSPKQLAATFGGASGPVAPVAVVSVGDD